MKAIVIYSGKGGVGKTTTTANLAKTLAEQGKKVFIIDADINTPSMGVIFGNDHPSENIYIASTSFTHTGIIYMEKSLVRSFIRQAINKINKVNPDFVLIDTPPSITDVHINLIETIEISAIVIVTQPNELSRADVNRTALFFSDRATNAGVIVVENMVPDNTEAGEYNWQLVERISLEPSFNGELVYEKNKSKYQNIISSLDSMNIDDVRLKARKKLLFDETITEDQLPYARYTRNLSKKDIKFVNVSTWDYVRDILIEMDETIGFIDQRLVNVDSERIKKMIAPFEHDDEAYFIITRVPNVGISLLSGEIGKATLAIHGKAYGLPVVKYQTKEGEVTLFPDEVSPASEKTIQIAMAEGSVISSDGRYIPSKEMTRDIYNTFGNLSGMGSDWERVWNNIMFGKEEKEKENMVANHNVMENIKARRENKKYLDIN